MAGLRPWLSGWTLVIAATSMWVAYGVAAQTAKLKPSVPVGVDPGGVAIGLITTGIDYRRPEIARCLARDGEGRLIGWDVVERDGLPFAVASGAAAADDSLLVSAVDCSGRARIVPVRVDPNDPRSISRALAFIATTPARVVVLPVGQWPTDWTPFRLAATEFKQLLIVVAVGAVTATGSDHVHPTAGLPNVVLVFATAAGSEPEVSMLAMGHAVHFAVCARQSVDRRLSGAELAALFGVQFSRSSQIGLGALLSPKCP